MIWIVLFGLVTSMGVGGNGNVLSRGTRDPVPRHAAQQGLLKAAFVRSRLCTARTCNKCVETMVAQRSYAACDVLFALSNCCQKHVQNKFLLDLYLI